MTADDPRFLPHPRPPAADEPVPPGFGKPHVWVNCFNVRVEAHKQDGVTRLAFADALIGRHGTEHGAYIMRTSDAVSLAEAILKAVAGTK